jgi:NAD(P)-dependent dehydrogenase (short-subunit alcohol dehydrogenase family)
MSKKLEGQVAVVTGASKGIGEAIAEHLADAGTITRSLAQELGPRKIRVNAICPGVIETEGLHAAGISGSDFQRQMESQTPLGRIGQPQDIAPAVVFLRRAACFICCGPSWVWMRMPTRKSSSSIPCFHDGCRR